MDDIAVHAPGGGAEARPSGSEADEAAAPSSRAGHWTGGSASPYFGDGDGEATMPPFSWRKLWAFTGPGLLMSIAYLDPGNIESDLQAGATAGYSLLWLLLWATVMGLVMQLLAARVGVATGCHLAELCRQIYPRGAKYTLWIMTELAIVGSDIQEVIGSAIALRVLSQGAISLWAGVLITAIDGFLFLFLENFGVRKLEALFAGFISIMALAFARMYVEAQPNGRAVLAGLVVPYVPPSAVDKAVGIVGAVIMPHNIFLHSALVQSRRVDTASSGQVRDALRYYSIESAGALAVSFFINLAVMAVFAKTFFGTPEASTIGLVNAGYYLDKKFGTQRFPIIYIWAAGLLAAGQSSTITGTYAGQFVMEGFLDLRIKKWQRVLLTRSVAIVPTITVALAFDNDNHLDVLNEWLNVLQSMQLPFALIPLLTVASSAHLMGTFTISKASKVVAVMITMLVLAINAYLVVVFAVVILPRKELLSKDRTLAEDAKALTEPLVPKFSISGHPFRS
eukprot:SM000024S07873  [mRNA]  locus=s24:1060203:1063531:- [translate_table: standard]